MAYEDKGLTCVECGAGFTFSASEQEFFAAKGFSNEPKRCPHCRESRRQRRRDGQGDSAGIGYPRQREMYDAVCANCGQETRIPFKPSPDRAVYCSSCYAIVRQ
ncbi:MAG: zinc-ribbon domain containing protein [Chloroflexota bacterium]|nr:zinc-ribbon domain containing protein [Chloroflexota bacterium]